MLLLCRKYLDVHVSGTDLNLFIDIEVRNYKGGFASKSMMFIANFIKIHQLVKILLVGNEHTDKMCHNSVFSCDKIRNSDFSAYVGL